MSIDQEDEGVLALLDELSREHAFRNIKTGLKTMPDLATLRSTVTDLLNAIRPICVPSPLAPRVPEDA
jgi:hypothetical protein